jgi:hypothetical protein
MGYAQNLYSRIYSIDKAVEAGELDEAGALEAAEKSFADYASTLPDEYANPIREKLRDGLTIDELRQIKALNAGALNDYGLLDEDDPAQLQQADYIDADGNAVQGAFDPDTGKYSSQGERPIAPQATQQELNDTSLTDAGINAVTQKFRTQAQSLAVNAATATELVDLVNRSPEALAKSGALVTFGSEAYTLAKNLMNLVNEPPLPAEETKLQDGGNINAWDWSELDKQVNKLGILPVDAARMKAGLYSLAFSAAVGEQGSRPSDKDIQAYISIYGGEITNPDAFKGTIAQAMRRSRNTLYFMAEMNPEIQNPRVQLDVFDREYNKFLESINESVEGIPKGYTGPTARAADGGLLILSEDGTEWIKARP